MSVGRLNDPNPADRLAVGTMERLIVFRVGSCWFARAIEVKRSESGSLEKMSWVSISQSETAMRWRAE